MPAVGAPPLRPSPAQLDEYRERGFLLVRGVFSPLEMAIASMEAERLLAGG